jgi:type VI protein secretion system component Hcp
MTKPKSRTDRSAQKPQDIRPALEPLGETELTAVSGAGSRATFSSFSIVKVMDKASPLIY